MSVDEKDMIKICGGNPLSGMLSIQGSKNAVLPLMAASLLIKGKTVLYNCPRITDVFYMKKLLQSIGCEITEYDAQEVHFMELDATNIYEYRLPGEYVEKMRSSIITLGPLLARIGEIQLPQPGGCTIGKRPIDLHLQAMEKLGAEINLGQNYLHGSCKQLCGCEIQFPIVSVGATENAILAAALADGVTIIENAALEPEIQELCHFLNQAGAQITISFTDKKIRITGVKELKPVRHKIAADRIVAGTYAFGCMVAGGKICLQDAPISYMEATFQTILSMGGVVKIHGEDLCIEEDITYGAITIEAPKRCKAVPYVTTAAYPGFATDMQSSFLTVASVAEGDSILRETIFENRFQVMEELCRMGADIKIHKELERQYVTIHGVDRLEGRNVLAKELRGGAALVLAGIAAQGITCVGNLHFIQRGYEDIGRDLKLLGAKISQVTKDANQETFETSLDRV